MAKTGERYSAARRALIEARGPRPRTWVSDPEVSDARVTEATGHGWDAWCDLLEAWPGKDSGHKAIAAHVRDGLGVDAWWAQSVTVGFERITGRRLPGQMADGTFTANKSKTLAIDGLALRALLLDEAARADLFPGHESVLRSRPTSKSLRVKIGPGVALFSLDAAGSRPDEGHRGPREAAAGR